MSTAKTFYSQLALLTVILALIVVMAGAFTRLSHAGLGCPDWPGCYAQLTVPETQASLAKAQHAFPGHVVHEKKAWIEMGHRYIAGILAILIFILSIWGLCKYRQLYRSTTVCLLMMLMIVFQALLGMWTVTLKLMPLVVMGHLLGGFTLLSLLWWLTLKSNEYFTKLTTEPILHKIRFWAVLALLLVIGQIILGGWTSANYAALVCLGLPFCHVGSLTQTWDVHQAFQLWIPFDHVSLAAKQTIQMVHRMGSLVVTFVVGWLSLRLWFAAQAVNLRRLGGMVLLLLLIQLTLGLLNIVFILPLPIAVAHNGFAALLLLSIITVNYVAFKKS